MRKSKAQSITEYVIVLGVVIVALMVMQIYMQRGIQGVVKTVADEVGDQKQAEEVDPIKGAIKRDANITRVTGGEPEGSENLPKGVTMRVVTPSGGGRSTYFNTISTTTGTSNTESQQPQ